MSIYLFIAISFYLNIERKNIVCDVALTERFTDLNQLGCSELFLGDANFLYCPAASRSRLL